jgi:threonine aldolase
METIDLRSDTVTHPTPAMREAMANARVGDDVYGEDPTVIELQNYAADLLGKEAALYMPTATMSNVASALTHCGRGDEMIVSKKAHMFLYEQGGPSSLGGISMNALPVGFDGTMSLEEIEDAIREDDPHCPRTALICLENTAHGAGGTPISAEYTARVGEIARKYNLKVHLDGARLFNAAAALKVHPRALVEPVDSVQLCLSKGLCAPVGSLLVGSREFITRALRTRKVMGGGMRQAGVIAAAGLIALRDMRERLVEDHATAQQLADGLASLPGVIVDPVHMRTNMVFFSIPQQVNVKSFVGAMQARNVILRGGPHFRAVTHYWITPERATYAVETLREVLAQHMQVRQ